MTAPESYYIHGTSSAEQSRLSALNGFINRAALRELNLTGHERILDVGCGLAQFTCLMARALQSSGPVVGIERDAAQLKEAQRQAAADGDDALLDLRAGDACALPLSGQEWGTFDLVHARFLLEHVRDPLSVVKEMVKAARPGGRVVLQDDDHDVMRLYPEPAGFWTLWSAYMRTYDRHGCDPFVGRRLVSLLAEAGAAPVRNTWLFFGTCVGDANYQATCDNLIGVLIGARDSILEQKLLDQSTFDAGIHALREWTKRPDAAIWYAIAWAEGIMAQAR